jgi:AcrR family transcriptional regulator
LLNLVYIGAMSTSITVRRTQAERTRASREKIIEAATELFSQQGFRGAKMADIAKAADLTEPGLLHHFPSKTALLTAVLAERDRANDERFHIYLAGENQDLLASLLKLAEHNETVPGLVQLFTILAAESIQEQHPGHDFFQRRYEAVRAQGVAVLRQAQARGEVRVDVAAEDLIVMVFAMMDGLQIQWLYDPDKVDMARIFGQFVRLLKVEPG